MPAIRNCPTNAYFYYSKSFILFYKDPLNIKIKDLSTKSNYLDFLMAKVYTSSANLSNLFDNVRSEFEDFVKKNDRICEPKACPPQEQKTIIYDNWRKFSKHKMIEYKTNLDLYDELIKRLTY